MNTKSIVAGIIIAAALVSPFAASALSIEDLQQQIKDLLARVAALQQQIKGQTVASTSPAVEPQKKARICTLINRNLSRGQSGDDVSGLQEFLTSEGYLNVTATGFFGPATASALAKWQAKNNISAIGSFGPLSRERIKLWCGNSGTNGNGLLTVSPQSGSAPLTVTVTSYTGDALDYRPSMADGQDTLIDFGDGSERQWVHCPTNGQEIYPARCVTPVSMSHTYTADGVYVVSIVKSGGMCIGGCKETTLASEKVVVGTSVRSDSLTADPQRGAAPLPVKFTYQPANENGQYWIDFGDGEGQQMDIRQIYCIRAPCVSPFGASHTYKNSGSYTVTVSPYLACMHSNPRCMIATMPLAQTTVTVTGSNTNETFSAIPTNGAAPLPVIFTARVTLLDPTKVADGNSYKIAFGDGTEHVFTCTSSTNGTCEGPHTATHTYAAGTYTAQLISYGGFCAGNCTSVIGTVTVYSGTSNGSGSPVISSFSGPVLLSVNEIGTWKITASDPENGTLKYSILWGDEWTQSDAAARMMVPSAGIQQNSSFTHSYATAGNYTVALTVTDETGKEARSTATVQVSQTACTKEYKPVCGRPNGCMNTCAPGMYCTMVCQLAEPTTYSNRCVMNNSNATFMHEGACTGNEGYLQ